MKNQDDLLGQAAVFQTLSIWTPRCPKTPLGPAIDDAEDRMGRRADAALRGASI